MSNLLSCLVSFFSMDGIKPVQLGCIHPNPNEKKKIRPSCWDKSIDQSCKQLVEGCKNTVIIYFTPSILISLLDVCYKQMRPLTTLRSMSALQVQESGIKKESQ